MFWFGASGLFSFFFTDRRAAWNLFDLVMNVTSLLDPAAAFDGLVGAWAWGHLGVDANA